MKSTLLLLVFDFNYALKHKAEDFVENCRLHITRTLNMYSALNTKHVKVRYFN